MCRQTTCKKCGQASWTGCGAHVEQVLGHVPKSERCECNAKRAVRGAKRTTPKKEFVAVGASSEKKRWFRR